MTDDIAQPSNKSLNEQFYRRFQNQVLTIEDQISQISSKSVTGGERHDAIDHCLAAIAQLSSDVGQASGYTPAYDQRSYTNTIKTLSEKLQETRASLAPKQKFAFKSARRQPPSTEPPPAINPNEPPIIHQPIPSCIKDTSTVDASAIEPTESSNTFSIETSINTLLRETSKSGPRKPSFSQTNRILLENHTAIHIILPSSAGHATGASILRSLSNCVVDLSIPSTTLPNHRFAGLTLQTIRNSLIVCGQVAGPLHVTDMKDSVIVTTCRQFRMHSCTNIDVYLHCGSRPIIEDCRGIRFAPLPECFIDDELRGAVNQWNRVDDFKWLKVEGSPHWGVLPEVERIKEGVWREVVPGGPGVGVADILAAVRSGIVA